MIPDAVHEILRGYAEVDTDAGELASVLNTPQPPPWRDRFHDDLAATIRAGALTPEAAKEIMFRDFDDQAELDRWLRDAWALWFPGEPYPAPQA